MKFTQSFSEITISEIDSVLPKVSVKVENSESVYIEIIEYLNLNAGKKFLVSTKSHHALIDVLFDRGFKQIDIYKVIDSKSNEWMSEKVMKKYLRPQTLFDTSNFKRYLKEADIQS